MALRLTKTSLPALDVVSDVDPALTRYHAENEIVTAFGARAGIALGGTDLTAYRQLFTETGALENPHRRYQVRKLLLEHGLASLRSASDKRATELLLAMAWGAVISLEAEPAEPVLLNYAGVLLYELWALDAARALFLAAQRLDPELPHLERNLKGVSDRNRSGNHRKLAFHPALVDLTKRAKRVAARAKPAEGLRLSLCMIVRDEEDMLPRTLEAAKRAVDEIIIVDTGSQDSTIEIAKSFGATVIEREWTGSFSDARNVSLEAATGDWFIYLDADEVLVTEDVEKLRGLLGQTWREAFFLHETNFTGTEEAGLSVVHSALRLFRNRPEYRFRGRLHEQIAVHLPAYLPERLAQSPVRVNHYGYLGVVRDAKDKSRRNIDLLLAQERESAPGSLNSFFHYNLGSEYFAVGEIDKALDEYEQGYEKLKIDGTYGHEYIPSLMIRSVKALRAAGRNDDAIERADVGLAHFPGYTDLVYEQGLASIALDRPNDAATYLERAIEMGDAPSKYTAIVGAGTFLPRIVLATMHLNRRQTDPGLQHLRWCVENHPEYIGTVHPYATALLQSGEPADAVIADVEQRFTRLPAASRFMLGTALFEQGQAVAAETQFRVVLEKQPHSGAARAALVESLLYQRRYREAAEEAKATDADSAAAVITVRSELFARLLDGDLDGTDDALSRAGRVGLSEHEQQLFKAWLGEARGEPHAAPPAAAVPLLSRMLESLLRVRDFENFEKLVPLLNMTPLAERERHELLAQMYLRRGFLRSAGREWMAVCERQPDVRALVGLAHVALANGQSAAAKTFAENALALDPENETARKIAAASSEPVPA
jgi:glycosyltransferase involved in cell wall biosynthesis